MCAGEASGEAQQCGGVRVPDSGAGHSSFKFQPHCLTLRVITSCLSLGVLICKMGIVTASAL